MKRLLATALLALCLCTPAHAVDTLKAVRATMAADKAAQAKVDAAQEARLLALEQAQAQKTATATVPAPAPAPATPAPAPAASTVYPKGVDLAGLRGVYDARPGPLRALTNKPPSSWPVIVPGSLAVGPGALADLDASGFELYLNGGAVSIDNARLGLARGLYSFAVGHVNGGGKPGQLTLTNAVVDQANTNTGYGAAAISGGSTFTASRVSFLRASGTNLNLDGDSSLTDVYFDSPGQNASSDAHTEGPHYFRGRHTVLRGLFDARNMAGKNTHATGQIYVEAANASVEVAIRDSILVGAAAIGIYAPIQVAAKPGFTATLRMDNVVLQAGNSPHPGARYVVPAGGTVKIVCTLCRDADTGEVVDAVVNAMTPQ